MNKPDHGQGSAPASSSRDHGNDPRLRAILETAVDGIITIDRRGVIESVNPAGERIFGYTAAEMIGRNISMLMPSPYRESHDTYLSNYLGGAPARIIGIGREVVGQRKDGSVFPMDLSVSEWKLGDQVLFTGFVRDITGRKRLELEVLEVSEREQRRIGQDLHDGLGQHLAGLELMSEALQQKLALAKSAEARKAAVRMADIAGYVREAITQTRLLARGLVPVVVESEGLMAALGMLAATSEKLFGIKCSFECEVPVLIPDHSVATHLYRIAQEALSNAIKHGRAKRVRIALRAADGRTLLSVKDYGVGFPETLPRDKGMGLRIMQYRAGMVGGSLAIQRDLDGGTTVVCSLHGNPISPACTP